MEIRKRVIDARDFRVRVRKQNVRNSDLSVGQLESIGTITQEGRTLLSDACSRLDLSSRAIHSVLRVSRTIADLKQSEQIDIECIKEAILYRRYGDSNFLWSDF